MKSENLVLKKEELVDQGYEQDIKVQEKVNQLMKIIYGRNLTVSPFIVEFFEDKNLFQAINESIKGDLNKFVDLIVNTSKFDDIIYIEREKRFRGDITGLLGEDVHIDQTKHADGRNRKVEYGERININCLRDRGIDSSKVLFFRITQPSEQPKPEWYWTSDYFETIRGLGAEIPAEQRRRAVILVSTLDVINNNGGLIQDINDDQGLAVRQIGTGSFDQRLAMTRIKV